MQQKGRSLLQAQPSIALESLTVCSMSDPRLQYAFIAQRNFERYLAIESSTGKIRNLQLCLIYLLLAPVSSKPSRNSNLFHELLLANNSIHTEWLRQCGMIYDILHTLWARKRFVNLGKLTQLYNEPFIKEDDSVLTKLNEIAIISEQDDKIQLTNLELSVLEHHLLIVSKIYSVCLLSKLSLQLFVDENILELILIGMINDKRIVAILDSVDNSVVFTKINIANGYRNSIFQVCKLLQSTAIQIDNLPLLQS